MGKGIYLRAMMRTLVPLCQYNCDKDDVCSEIL